MLLGAQAGATGKAPVSNLQMTDVPTQSSETAPPQNGFASLTAREAELLRKAGDRIFALSRGMAEAEKAVQRLELELRHTRELLTETRASRDVLSSQVSAMQRELEREFVERSELRRLLSNFQMQVQTMLTPYAPEDYRPRLGQGREAPQRQSRPEWHGGHESRDVPWGRNGSPGGSPQAGAGGMSG